MTIKQTTELVIKYASKVKVPDSKGVEAKFKSITRRYNVNLLNAGEKNLVSFTVLLKYRNVYYIYSCKRYYQGMFRDKKGRITGEAIGLIAGFSDGKHFRNGKRGHIYSPVIPKGENSFRYIRISDFRYGTYSLYKGDYSYKVKGPIGLKKLRRIELLDNRYVETAYKQGGIKYIDSSCKVDSGKGRTVLELNELNKKDLNTFLEIVPGRDVSIYKDFIKLHKKEGGNILDPNGRILHDDYVIAKRNERREAIRIKQEEKKLRNAAIIESMNIISPEEIKDVQRIDSLEELKEHGVNQNHCVGVVYKDFIHFGKTKRYRGFEITIRYTKEGRWEIRSYDNLDVPERLKLGIKQLVIKDAERRWNDAIQNAKQ